MSYFSEISVRAPGSDDPYEDKCAPMFEESATVAVLEINGTIIPLSLSRVNDLITQVTDFSKTIFCYKCENFIMSRSGWRYGGSCKLEGKKRGKEITSELAGFECCVDCTHTCSDAVERSTPCDS